MFRFCFKRSQESGATLVEAGILTAGIAVASVLAVANVGVSSSEPLCASSNSIGKNGAVVQAQYQFIPGAGCFAHCPLGNPGLCCGMTPQHYCPPLTP